MESKDVIRSLAALAHSHRLEIFRALVLAGAGGTTPGVMAKDTGMPPATLSFHLKELLNAGLATQERQGRHLIYRAAFAHMQAVLGYLTENCCQGQGCAKTPPASCTKV